MAELTEVLIRVSRECCVRRSGLTMALLVGAARTSLETVVSTGAPFKSDSAEASLEPAPLETTRTGTAAVLEGTEALVRAGALSKPLQSDSVEAWAAPLELACLHAVEEKPIGWKSPLDAEETGPLGDGSGTAIGRAGTETKWS